MLRTNRKIFERRDRTGRRDLEDNIHKKKYPLPLQKTKEHSGKGIKERGICKVDEGWGTGRDRTRVPCIMADCHTCQQGVCLSGVHLSTQSIHSLIQCESYRMHSASFSCVLVTHVIIIACLVALLIPSVQDPLIRTNWSQCGASTFHVESSCDSYCHLNLSLRVRCASCPRPSVSPYCSNKKWTS